MHHNTHILSGRDLFVTDVSSGTYSWAFFRVYFEICPFWSLVYRTLMEVRVMAVGLFRHHTNPVP